MYRESIPSSPSSIHPIRLIGIPCQTLTETTLSGKRRMKQRCVKKTYRAERNHRSAASDPFVMQRSLGSRLSNTRGETEASVISTIMRVTW